MTLAPGEIDHFQLAGGCHFDERLIVEALELGQSVPVSSLRQIGGVAFNVASTLKAQGVPLSCHFCCGDDVEGQSLRLALEAKGFDAPRPISGSTPRYLVIEDTYGTVLYGLADMALYDAIGYLDAFEDAGSVGIGAGSGAHLIVDTNLPPAFFAGIPHVKPASFTVAATSPAKVRRLMPALSKIDLLFLNHAEAQALTGSTTGNLAMQLMNAGLRGFVLTNGDQPVSVFDGAGLYQLEPPILAEGPVTETGLGDRLAGLTLAEIYRGQDLKSACTTALETLF